MRSGHCLLSWNLVFVSRYIINYIKLISNVLCVFSNFVYLRN